MDQKIFSEAELLTLVSAEALKKARSYMDALSISALKVDLRGRLEAAVKPAPPSTQPPSYVRITRRGNRFRADCNHHGRDTWCLHAAILALHHLGAQPIYREKAAKEVELVQSGLQFVARFQDGRLALRIRSKNAYVAHPKRFMLQEYGPLRLDSTRASQLSELVDEDTDPLCFSQEDSAEALTALRDVALFNAEGQAFERKITSFELPVISVRLTQTEIYWTAEPALPDGVQLLSGWPGYLIFGNEIQKVSGYLPKFQFLQGISSPLPLNYENLAPLVREKHRVHWVTPKPIWCEHIDSPGLELGVEGRDLAGQIGAWIQERFFPINHLGTSRQILSSGKQLALLSERAWNPAKIRSQAAETRLPLIQDGSFLVREQQAPGFLEQSRFPEAWRVTRHKVDQFFGLISSPIETLWAEGRLLPQYRIGDDLFDHDEVVGYLLPSGTGARLGDGRILQFDTSSVVKIQHILQGLGEIHEDDLRKADLLARVVQGRHGEDGPEPGEPWTGLLRSYQMEGVRWMAGNLGREEPALLADDMGLGKTIQTLALLDMFRGEGPQLVIVPTSLLVNWKEEAARFCPERTVTIHHGAKRAKVAAELEAADLVITSYGTLLRDSDMFYDVCFHVVVLDEAQSIKNSASRTARAIYELWCNHRVALTGTPVENRLTELWSIFRYLAPGYLGDEDEIAEITLPGTPAYEALKAKIMPFLKRRKKQDVEKELPAKQEQVVLLPMEDSQIVLYRQFQRESLTLLKNGKAGTVSILTRLLRLRQACCHPGLLDESQNRHPSNKLNYLTTQLQDVVASGHSALVFSQFTKFLSLVRYALEELEIPYLYLDGKTLDRQDLVHRFQGGEAPVFLISLKAGGVGLNLTRASYVYHLDPWWNPAVEAQATDRAHRIGQTKTVFSYKLISQGTVEERILQLQAQKRFLSDGLWEDADSLFAQLDHDTLLSLLS